MIFSTSYSQSKILFLSISWIHGSISHFLYVFLEFESQGQIGCHQLQFLAKLSLHSLLWQSSVINWSISAYTWNRLNFKYTKQFVISDFFFSRFSVKDPLPLNIMNSWFRLSFSLHFLGVWILRTNRLSSAAVFLVKLSLHSLLWRSSVINWSLRADTWNRMNFIYTEQFDVS